MNSTLSKPLSLEIAFAAIIFSGIIMGFSPVFVREAEVGPFASAFWRVFFALPLLFLWAWNESKKDTLNPNVFALPVSGMLAGVFFSGDLVFWHLSILNTTMANATFTVCLSVVWVALLSNLVLGEKVSGQFWIGLFLCLVGLALLVNSSLQLEPARLLGDIYGIITSFFLGAYMLAMRAARRHIDGGRLFLSSTLVTMIILFVAALIAGDAMLATSSKGWFSLVSLGVFTHAAGQGLVTLALGVLSAVFSSLVIFIEAVTAAFFGWLLFDETMSWMQTLGGILILSGVWLARPKKD